MALQNIAAFYGQMFELTKADENICEDNGNCRALILPSANNFVFDDDVKIILWIGFCS